jgi:hypothetical protein
MNANMTGWRAMNICSAIRVDTRIVLKRAILLRGMVRVLLRAIVSEDFFRDLGGV